MSTPNHFDMRPPYLSGEGYYLRAMVPDDAKRATAWFPGPFPINAARAENWLKDEHPNAWGDVKTLSLVVIRDDGESRESEEIVGGARVGTPRERTSEITITPAPHFGVDAADRLKAEVLKILIPWARDELELMTVSVYIPADESESIAAAEVLGMERTARLREFIARPGIRVDLLLYQALNPNWRVVISDSADA